jgi:hypothetical protein
LFIFDRAINGGMNVKKVIVERRVAVWDELTAEQKESEIEKLSNDKCKLQVFFDGAYELYDNALREIAAETESAEYRAVKFIRDKVFWQSGSQGWYYDHCSPADFLVCKAFRRDKGHYFIELRDVDTYRPAGGGRHDYEHAFEWYVSIVTGSIVRESSGEFADIKAEFEGEGWDVPIEAIRLVKGHEERYREEFKELKEQVEDEIRRYNEYWPDEEEIAEYFRFNETEFVISEDEVERASAGPVA